MTIQKNYIDADNIHKRMFVIRKQKNLSQRAFAEFFGVSGSYIAAVETGKNTPSFNLIMSVLKVIQVNADWLLLGKGSMYPPIKEKKEEIKEINEDRAAYGVDKSPGFDDELNNLKSHWDKLSDEQKKSLMRHVKNMIKNNEMAEENRKLKDFIIKMATKQPGEIPSNVVQGLTD
jgi:transcriptional regulator with XRE-family HTH domain